MLMISGLSNATLRFPCVCVRSLSISFETKAPVFTLGSFCVYRPNAELLNFKPLNLSIICFWLPRISIWTGAWIRFLSLEIPKFWYFSEIEEKPIKLLVLSDKLCRLDTVVKTSNFMPIFNDKKGHQFRLLCSFFFFLFVVASNRMRIYWALQCKPHTGFQCEVWILMKNQCEWNCSAHTMPTWSRHCLNQNNSNNNFSSDNYIHWPCGTWNLRFTSGIEPMCV